MVASSRWTVARGRPVARLSSLTPLGSPGSASASSSSRARSTDWTPPLPGRGSSATAGCLLWATSLLAQGGFQHEASLPIGRDSASAGWNGSPALDPRLDRARQAQLPAPARWASASPGGPTHLKPRRPAAVDRQVHEGPVDWLHRPDRPLGQVGDD